MDFSIMEELWFGELSDQPAEQEAAKSMVAFMAEIHDLKPFPASAQKLIQITRDPNYSVNLLEKIIESDPSLAARILRIVNSAAYSLQSRCSSISHAIVILGGRALSEIATAIAVFNLFSEGAHHPQVKAVRDHSAAVAALARALSTQRGLQMNDIYTCGLLHDLGKLLLLQMGDIDYPTLLEKAGPQRDTIHKREREIYIYDHAVLAGHVLRMWKIPDPVPMVVSRHHQVERANNAGGATAKMINLVRLADRLAYDFDQIAAPDSEFVEELNKDSELIALGFSGEEISAKYNELREIVLESREILADTVSK